MKTLFLNLILIWSISTSLIQTKEQLTPKNCIIAFDLDDTLTKYSPLYKVKIVGYGLSLNPFKSQESWHYLKALNAMRTLKKKKPLAGNQDTTYPQIIGGAFLQLTYAGIQEKNLRPYIKGLIELVWKNATFKESIPQLLTYLYEQGYELWIATNKDHVSYTQIIDTLDSNQCFKLAPLVKHSFVVWPKKETLEKLYTFESQENSEFQELINMIPTIKETAFIHHSHEPKPSSLYYEKMKQVAKGKKIIFFDDIKENIVQAKKHGILGYRISHPKDIIQRLEKLNILNPARDQQFYEQLQKFTFFKKILFWV